MSVSELIARANAFHAQNYTPPLRVIEPLPAIQDEQQQVEKLNRPQPEILVTAKNKTNSIAKRSIVSTAMNLLTDLDEYLDTALLKYNSIREKDSSITFKSSVDAGLPTISEASICDHCHMSLSPLLQSVTIGHISCLKYVLTRDKVDLHSIKTPNGASALHIAAKRGDESAIQVLLAHDLTAVKLQDCRGATPTHVAAYNGKLGILNLLLTNGGSPIQKANDGATPVHFAASTGNLACLKELAKCDGFSAKDKTSTGITPTYFSAQEGHLECLKWLIHEADGDPNTRTVDGMTSLHAAAQTGKLNCIHWLVRQAKCNVNVRTIDGATPMHFAAARGQVAIVEWLMNLMLTDGSERDDFGATPIHDSAEQGQLECLKVFASWGIDLNIQDDDGLTPLDLATQRRHLDCVKFLRGFTKGGYVRSAVITRKNSFKNEFTDRKDDKHDNSQVVKKFKWPWKK